MIETAEKPGSGLPKPEVKTFVNTIALLVKRQKWEDAMRVLKIVEARKGNWVRIVRFRAEKELRSLEQIRLAA